MGLDRLIWEYASKFNFYMLFHKFGKFLELTNNNQIFHIDIFIIKIPLRRLSISHIDSNIDIW